MNIRRTEQLWCAGNQIIHDLVSLFYSVSAAYNIPPAKTLILLAMFTGHAHCFRKGNYS